MSQVTTTLDITNVNSFFDRDLLFRAQPRLVFNRFGQIRDIPEGNSSTIRFRKYANLSVATTPLIEGVTPPGKKLSATDSYATVQQYGDYLTMTDKLTMTTADPVRMEANMILGDQAGNTLDQLARDIILAGTNVIYSGTGHTNRNQVAAGDVITLANIQTAEDTLKANNTMWMNGFENPTNPYNTVPLPPTFIGICHIYTTRAIRAMTGFTKVELYSNPATRMDGEIGKIENTRFIETVNSKVFTGAGAGGIDVYGTVIFGMYAFATTRIGGHALENIAKPLGSAGSADPLNQRETVGWKATFTAKILNDDFVVRIESARV